MSTSDPLLVVPSDLLAMSCEDAKALSDSFKAGNILSPGHTLQLYMFLSSKRRDHSCMSPPEVEQLMRDLRPLLSLEVA
jgi:hypothetical protein